MHFLPAKLIGGNMQFYETDELGQLLEDSPDRAMTCPREICTRKHFEWR